MYDVWKYPKYAVKLYDYSWPAVTSVHFWDVFSRNGQCCQPTQKTVSETKNPAMFEQFLSSKSLFCISACTSVNFSMFSNINWENGWNGMK